MTLKDIKNKKQYTSGWDDLIGDFLKPMLSQATQFDYITGYFSPSIFLVLFPFLKDFLKNGGHMRLIVGVLLEEKKTCDISTDELENYLKDEIDEFSKNINSEEYLKLFSWLVLNNRIEIKYAYPIVDPSTSCINEEFGILHEKIGIFSDGENFVTFSGSINLTYMAWMRNREEFKVFNSWDETQEYALYDVNKFQVYWNNEDIFLKVTNIPPNFKKYLVNSFSVDNLDDIDFNVMEKVYAKEIKKTLFHSLSLKLMNDTNWVFEDGMLKSKIETIELWNPQKLALEYLKTHEYTGFLAMATGTGKTKTAIVASYNLYKELKQKKYSLVSIILVPDKYLVEQWYRELTKYSQNVLRCHSEIKDWLNKLKQKVNEVFFLSCDHLYIIGTISSLNQDILNREIINKKGFLKITKILIISDEAHSMGTSTGIRIIDSVDVNYKIGLSATPTRYFDDYGTKRLLDWFLVQNQEVFSYDLGMAQKFGVICRFSYNIRKCYFDDNDIDIFNSLSSKIYKISSKRDEITNECLIESIQRADLIKKCKLKKYVLKDIIEELFSEGQFRRCVIYCKDNEQIERDVISAITELNRDGKINIRYNIITGEMNIPERLKYIEFLETGVTNCLIAMKCLDQGVDIPILEKAIFMASSGSPLEHIQRVGRILRKSEKKANNIEIYDIIVIPTQEQILNHPKMSTKILEIEKKRISFFSEFAENKLEIEELLYELETINI